MPFFRLPLARPLSAAVCLALSPIAHASCGATSCNLINDRFALGTWDRTGWSADLRLESVTQDRLHEGRRHIDASALPDGEEAIERHTRNLNLVATLENAIDPQWSVALRLPVLSRDHAHDLLDEEAGAPGAHERWRFTRLGDVQALLRWQAPAPSTDVRWALTGGLKLPTGPRTVANGDGSVAERALQPGSGTTDLILGASARAVLGIADALSVQFSWIEALNEKDGFRPGRRLDLSAGWAHAMSPGWSVLLQANLGRRGRDSGVQAEPSMSGSTTFSLSPGASAVLGHDDSVYGFVQVPLLQRTNGVQLVPTWSLALGWTHAF